MRCCIRWSIILSSTHESLPRSPPGGDLIRASSTASRRTHFFLVSSYLRNLSSSHNSHRSPWNQLFLTLVYGNSPCATRPLTRCADSSAGFFNILLRRFGLRNRSFRWMISWIRRSFCLLFMSKITKPQPAHWFVSQPVHCLCLNVLRNSAIMRKCHITWLRLICFLYWYQCLKGMA